ncbi:golgi reassembly stacking protein [Purpureocillium lilacinum]|uniref:Golgi reassembly stacking protein n=1 Tax=Purpureocillium lilacinum TaxID=33203 RepID=A0A179HL36_PURLI|nr:golgi reassembly stacking protein [Purpureocillium lilacinum]OAQ91126.1 golgi reassembly stacking protein [Purpureocillium lilacinum]GJN77703.1 hypothetical protein PLIIFM63780_001196 [Purpureocillium lilacinum]
MFNALNRFMSRLDGGEPQHRQHERGSFGFQVLRNTNLQLAVEPWFDFIVGINGRPIDDPNPSLFAQEVQNCAGGTVTLGLWNAKGQRTREMHIPVPSDSASLGLSLQYAPIALAANIWHVLDVAPNSPADNAALLPYSDYILGSPEGALHGEGALGELVEDHIGRPLRLYVYNNEYDVTREVTIQPSRGWGGDVNAPGETMFDGAMNEKSESAFVPANSAPPPTSGGEFLVPAQMVDSTPSGPPRSGKKKERHGHSPNQLMDDYFKEEEAKSREVDNAPTSKGSGVPPPPKASGGPPKAEPKTTEAGGGGDE